MRIRESFATPVWLNVLIAIGAVILLCIGLFTDPRDVFKAVGFPVQLLSGDRGQADLATIRVLELVIAITMIASQVLVWRDPHVVAKIAAAIKNFIVAALRVPQFTTFFLISVVLVKSALQLSLYLIGYVAFAGDDFSRSVKADDWLQQIYSKFDLAAWLNIGLPQLPFSDYLFGLALAIHRDVYVTPKIMNLFLSGILVVVVYRLGREIFGRAAGLFSAVLCAFQPYIIWLGISGMTSDIPSVIALSLFGLFLFRWLETSRSASLLAAAGCLFLAAGLRYENWFFSVIFSLYLVYRVILAVRQDKLTPKVTNSILAALLIANVFPVFHMAASYYLLGDLIPAMQQTDSFRAIIGPPIAKINIVLLALSAFALEIAAAVTGIILFLRTEKRRGPRIYLFIMVMTLFSFGAAFKGQLPLYGAGPQRILLPYMILLLPYAGYFLTRLFRARRLENPSFAILAMLLLLTVGAFDLTRAFNYPAKAYNRDAFAAGWTLRMLQTIGNIPDDGKIIVERDRGEVWIPYPILALANKPERFVRLEEGKVGKACNGGLQLPACKNEILAGRFNLMILSSADKVRTFQEMFAGRSWQIGTYHIFDLKASARDSQQSDFQLNPNASP